MENLHMVYEPLLCLPHLQSKVHSPLLRISKSAVLSLLGYTGTKQMRKRHKQTHLLV